MLGARKLGSGMFSVLAGLVILGAACGILLRLPMLVVLLLSAAAAVVVIDSARDGWDVFIHAAIVIIALQIGYASGISLRALVVALTWPSKSREGDTAEAAGHCRLSASHWRSRVGARRMSRRADTVPRGREARSRHKVRRT
jgi:hypothetical protein